MASRPATGVETLREISRYIDPALQPSSLEAPAILAALVYADQVDGLSDKIAELRKEGASDASISHEVSHLIAPPDPDAGAVVTQGVPVEAHQALQDEVTQLRQLVNDMHDQANPKQTVAPTSPQDQALQKEVNELRDLVASLSVSAAAEQHPTATVEQLPADDPTTPPPEAPASS